VNDGGGNGTSCGVIEVRTDTPKLFYDYGVESRVVYCVKLNRNKLFSLDSRQQFISFACSSIHMITNICATANLEAIVFELKVQC